VLLPALQAVPGLRDVARAKWHAAAGWRSEQAR